MNYDIINQYSTAFIETLKDDGKDLSKVYNEINNFKNAIIDNNQYIDLLKSSNISKEDKKKMIDELLDNNVYLKNMIFYMIDKNDQFLLMEILNLITKELSKLLNIINLKITSAFELDKKQIESICKKFESKLNKKVIPEIIIDKSYIAGISVEYDSKVIDNSIKAKLNAIKKELKKGE